MPLRNSGMEHDKIQGDEQKTPAADKTREQHQSAEEATLPPKESDDPDEAVAPDEAEGPAQ